MGQPLSQAEADKIAAEAACPIFRSILDRIGDRWSVMVLLELVGGPKRFNEMHRSLPGISRRMLTFTLRNLERDGLILREVYPTVPPKVEYSHTPLARELRHTMRALAEWAVRNREPVLEARVAFDERETERSEEPEKPANVTPPRPSGPGPRGRVPVASADRRVNGLGPVASTDGRAVVPPPRQNVVRAARPV